MSGASCVLVVNFPEHEQLRPRSIVVRQDGSTANELVSKVMAQSGLTGVGFFTMKAGAEDERTLGPKEDVYALATMDGRVPKDVVLFFRLAKAPNSPPPRPLPSLGAASAAAPPGGGFGIGGLQGGVGGSFGTADIDGDAAALAARVAEQEKLIVQLKLIEREQKKIIDAQARHQATGGVLSPRSGGSEQILSPRGEDRTDAEKLQAALNEERRQNQYHKQELEKLRRKTVQYAKRMKEAGVDLPAPPGDQFGGDDNPEEAAGCSTSTCVVS